MKIFIDIGHPAHVHYFRNFIFGMQQRGHTFLITARDKDCVFQLLEYYNLPYKSRGKGAKSLAGKLFYIFKAAFILFRHALKFKPDVFLSFASPYAAHAAFLSRKPHIAFDDTEHAKFEHLMYVPFTQTILTPQPFLKNMGKKQIRFPGYMELCALHPNYFKPNAEILKTINLKPNEEFVILRFVSWEASHDVGHSGISLDLKLQLITELKKRFRIFISSEAHLPLQLQPYRINIEPYQMHDVLAHASLFIGEGATMASECAMLGTPAIYVNSLDAGTLQEQANYQLIYSYRNSNGVLEKTKALISIPNLKKIQIEKRNKMLNEKIDVTAFMTWFVENYPASAKEICNNQLMLATFFNSNNPPSVNNQKS